MRWLGLGAVHKYFVDLLSDLKVLQYRALVMNKKLILYLN